VWVCGRSLAEIVGSNPSLLRTLKRSGSVQWEPVCSSKRIAGKAAVGGLALEGTV
jgi:hypothetical protein